MIVVGCAACGAVDNAVPDAGVPDAASDAVVDAPRCDVPAVTITHTDKTPGDAIVHVLDPAKYPAAQCNDGTPAYYVLRRGVGGGLRRWHLFLEGGGSCETAADCASRAVDTPELMTSAGVVDGSVYAGELAGIKSGSRDENPALYDANLVHIHYCSSDAWTGDRPAKAGVDESQMTHWHFRGRAILKAVIADLADFAKADEVLLTGTSAGGVGVASNADDVATLVPAGARYVAAMDAGYILVYPPYDKATGLESTQSPSPQELQFAAATVAWGGRGDLDCENAATDDASRARCRVPSLTVGTPAIRTPMFVCQAEQDHVQLQRLNADPKPPRPATVEAYRGRFAAAMKAQLATVATATVFAPNNTVHGDLPSTVPWTTLAIDGAILRDAFEAWYRDPCSAQRHIE